MEKEKRIDMILSEAADEIAAQGAWIGHAYGFEYMQGYYEPLVEFMTLTGLEADKLKGAYKEANNAFMKVSLCGSFMNPDDEESINAADRKFMDELTEAVKTVSAYMNGRKAAPVSSDEKAEFIGQLIDIFEDFLEEKGIDLPNEERDERDDPESAAIIYGTDYGILQSEIEETLKGWGVIEGGVR